MKFVGPGIAVIAVLAAVLVWLIPTPAVDVPERGPAPAQKPDAAPLDLAAITARPLFDRSRKPMEVAPEPAPAPAPEPEVVTVSLQGVIGNTEDGLTALLRMSNSDELFSRQVGDKLGDFVIESIEARRVIVRDTAGQTYALVLGNE